MKKILLISLLFSSCAGAIKHSNDSDKIKPQIVQIKPKKEKKTKISPIKKVIKVTNKKVKIKKSSLDLKYPKKLFDFWIKYFTKRDKERFQRHLNNAFLYKDEVQEILRKMNVPEDLFYVGLIESGYNMKIRSRANAVGPWQFIKGTGKRYGLRIDKYVDERRNLHKATIAAAKYFRDLYNIFGSWNLALCAYNAGEYGIIRKIRKGKTRDYLSLVKKKLLPKETVYYVPKLAAAKYLFNNYHKYGYKIEQKKIKKRLALDLKRSFNVSTLAKALKTSKYHLRKLNPDIKRDYIRVYKKGYKIYLDKNLHDKSSSLSKLTIEPVKKIIETRSPRYTKRTKNKYHRVKRGESLWRISKKYGLSIKELMSLNKLKKKSVFINQRLKVGESRVYIVKKGDNLHKISEKFDVTIAEILRFNALKSKVIFPRQKIFIPI